MDTSNLHTLLVPIDFGEASLNALQTAVAMAGRHQAKLLPVHVVTTDTVIVFPEGGMMMHTGIDAIHTYSLNIMEASSKIFFVEEDKRMSVATKKGATTCFCKPLIFKRLLPFFRLF